MMVYKRVKSTSHIRFHTEVKNSKSSLVQELVLLVHAGSVEHFDMYLANRHLAHIAEEKLKVK